jgi:hypothetical protein
MRYCRLLLLLPLMGCFSARYDLDAPDYVKCGSTICLAGSREEFWTRSVGPDFGGRSHDVYARLHGVDAKNFHALKDGWATDGRKVWCGRTYPITAANKLRALGGPYYAVEDEVWDGCYPVFPGPPPSIKPIVRAKSFEYVGCGVTRFGGSLYRWGGTAIIAGRDQKWIEPLPIADSSTLQIDPSTCLAHDNRLNFRIDGGRLIIAGTRAEPNAPSLPCGYARVGSTIYFHEKVVEGADAATFEVLTPNQCSLALARDAGHVYQYFKPLPSPGFDRATFEVFEKVESYDLARDRLNVYLYPRLQVIRGADPQTFKRVRPTSQCRTVYSRVSRDANHVYVLWEVVRDADPATFEIIEPSLDGNGKCLYAGKFARDARKVWAVNGMPREIVGADRDSFVVLPDGSARDNKRTYSPQGSPVVTPPPRAIRG